MDIPGWIMAAVAVIGVCGALYAWFEKRLGDEEDARLAIERDLAAYKLHVAQHHVTNAALRETEVRLINVLEKMSARVETMASRIESVVVELAKSRT